MQFRKRRKPTCFYVNLDVNQTRFDLQLVDITPQGAKLLGDHDITDLAEGVLEVRGQRVAGTVRWIERDALGFEFDTPLPEWLLVMLAQEKKSNVKKRFLIS